MERRLSLPRRSGPSQSWERLVSLLDPVSTLRLIESTVMDKEILQNQSLSFAAWTNLIKGTSNGQQSLLEDVRVLVKILHFMLSYEISL